MVYFSVKQMVENKELVMVGILIDSLRNLNPLSSRGGTWQGPLVVDRGIDMHMYMGFL